MIFNRRNMITAGLAGLGFTLASPGISWAAAATSKRFIFVIQRGAADGLAILAPTGDPDFIRARGDLAADSLSGTKLDSLFTLHPDMHEAAKLFAAKQASFVHAMASGYRERSHFDGQNILESGAKTPYGRNDGWLNRLLTMLPAAETRAVAIAPAIPLALRGKIEASSYAPSRLPGANDDLMQRVSMLYDQDAALSTLWAGALQTEDMAMGADANSGRGGAATGKMAAGLMAGPAGARVVMIETGGWDTHSGQKGRLSGQLKQLDAMIAALKEGLGPDWSNTLVMVATEFGRTVMFNGTGGSDHGTASAAMLFGGGLAQGGQVKSDWPGLAKEKLYESRDLRPTLRFEDFASDALANHYGLEPAKVKRTVFPDFI